MHVIDPLTLAAIGVVLVAMNRQTRPRFASLPVPADAYAAALARNRAEKPPRAGPGSPFGPRVDPFDPSVRSFHAGTDVRVPTGTPLLAVDAGTVVQIQRGTNAGNIVRYSTVHGRVSCMHLESITVDVGDAVQAGQQIGTTGATGSRSTGPHLHLELRPDGADSAVDPLPFFPV